MTTTKKNIRLHVRNESLLKSVVNALYLDFYLMNKTLPLNYNFKFVIDEISNINDKAQVETIRLKMIFPIINWIKLMFSHSLSLCFHFL